jgi:hypothetical protein
MGALALAFHRISPGWPPAKLTSKAEKLSPG